MKMKSQGPLFAKTRIATAVLLFSSLPMTGQAQESDAPMQLPDVNVTGQRINEDYNTGSSTIGGKKSTETRDIPQTVNVINRAVLDAQAATTLADALRNVPGITMTSGEGGQIGDNVNLRGFTARTDIYMDGMRDRGQYRRDTFALDSVEVLKGPSSLFFGRGSTGGVINQVSKAPLKKDQNQVAASIGTDDYYRTTADFNHVLSDHAAFRVALMAQDVSSTRDVVENKDWGIAPSLLVNLSKDTDLTLSAFVQRNRDIPDYGIPFAFNKPANVANDRFYGNTDDYFNQDATVGKIKLDHRFAPWVTLRNQVQYSANKLNARPTPFRVCTTAFNNAGSAPTGPCPPPVAGAAPEQITIQSDRRDREINDSSLFDQLDLLMDFSTGSFKHSLVAGLEIGRDRTRNEGYIWSARVLDNLGTFIPGPTPAGLTRAPAATYTTGKADTFGVYVNDSVAITPQWKVVAGVRRDRFSADADTITRATGATAHLERKDFGNSLRGGVIYQPDAMQSYYVSYGTSFNPSTEAVTISAAQALVEPEETASYEAGAKWDLMNGNLSLTSAIFRVDKFNARTTDPTLPSATAVSLDGETRVQGFEIGAIGRLTKNWQVIGGYTYLDSELVRSKDVTSGVNVQGHDLANTPHNTASLWTSYRFLQDFETGGGVYYVDKRFVTNGNISEVDAYWRMDAMFAYHRPSYDLQLNVQNLLNQDYYDAVVASENGRAVPGRGRTAILSATYKF